MDKAIVIAVVGLLLSYLSARALTSHARVESDRLVLKYPLILRLFMPMGSLLLVGLIEFTLWEAISESPGRIATVAFAVIGAVSLAVCVFSCLEFPLARLEVSDDGIESRSPWRRSRFVRWTDIQYAGFSAARRCLVIEVTDGPKLYAHLFLSGIRDLYAELRRRLPASAWKQPYPPFEANSA
jgi:hypothetical protein